MILQLIVLMGVVRGVTGYSSGAPPGKCNLMYPGHGVPAQPGPAPYRIEVSDNSFGCPTDNITGVISAPPSASDMKDPCGEVINYVQKDCTTRQTTVSPQAQTTTPITTPAVRPVSTTTKRPVVTEVATTTAATTTAAPVTRSTSGQADRQTTTFLSTVTGITVQDGSTGSSVGNTTSNDPKNNETPHNALGHVLPLTTTIFKLVRDIHITNAKNVTSRENDPTWRPCFLPIRTIFELNRLFQETHVLTKFHEEWAKNVTSKKTAPPHGGHVFSPIWTIFELVRDINETNVLNKFHDDWAKIVTSRVFTRNTAPPPGGYVFQRTGTIFELNEHIIKTNILTKLHEDWASNVTSTFRGINRTNVLTKFHEDRIINVASRVFTRQNVDDARRTTDD
ncbi:hypothetical protein DPMN_096386 [Dreissena polymorpha]|uniref:Uncharacterized protein n=1 Tax=Dreissena polymorpha TaxID=45954 RepID=A0A9D4L923_DREPO|nr:hypothetical protein DPMN_096386 [Dreissena polymorpha]